MVLALVERCAVCVTHDPCSAQNPHHRADLPRRQSQETCQQEQKAAKNRRLRLRQCPPLSGSQLGKSGGPHRRNPAAPLRFGEREVETGLWGSYVGTGIRKGRQRTSPTATSTAGRCEKRVSRPLKTSNFRPFDATGTESYIGYGDKASKHSS